MEYVKINKKDNVIIALENLKTGTGVWINGTVIVLPGPVGMGHKIAAADILQGEHIIKYGLPIGHAVCDIKKGEHVHTHNIKTNLGGLLEYKYNKKREPYSVTIDKKEVLVYKRANGEVAIRNEIWIIPTVGCVNGICDLIRERFLEEHRTAVSDGVHSAGRSGEIEGIDGIHVFPHNYGCSQLGEDHKNTRTILQDLVKHPNAGGVLLVGLGCENNQAGEFMETLGEYDPDRVKKLICQEVEDEITEGARLVSLLYKTIKQNKREKVPIGELKIGLECGGSDSFSGITANPLVGELSNYLVFHGGTAVLTEVPEMFGAETFLMERAASREVFNRIVELVNSFKAYFIKHGQNIYENPSPGNKEGGISTLEEKSLGAVEKSGKAEVTDVLHYGGRICKRGLNLLSAPGNDLVATTALAAAGCHMVIFTTGRGTPFGGPVPTLKVATGSGLFKKKKSWMDFNAGELVEDKKMEEVLEKLINLVVLTANGRETKNEQNRFRNMALFKTGVTL